MSGGALPPFHSSSFWPTWSILPAVLLSPDMALFWFLSYLTPFPMVSTGWGLLPVWGLSLDLFFLLSIFTSLMNSSRLKQMTPKFISSPDPAPELQTHIFNCLLATPLSCLITTFWTAFPNQLLLQPYRCQSVPAPPFQLLGQNLRLGHDSLSSSPFGPLRPEWHIGNRQLLMPSLPL